jgi:diguanylate cyclase (GGDEF)-like protein/PAS domain S-box-containing protein
MNDPLGLPPYIFRMRGLLLRSTLAVIVASVLAGVVAVAYTAYAANLRAHLASQTRLNELLDTVESTLKVACFAKDPTLAGELAQGLLGNSDVLAVTISTDQQVLAHKQRGAETAPNGARSSLLLRRPIYSPFDASKVVGSILLTPNLRVIEAGIEEEVRLATIQLSWQLAMVAFAVAAIMLLFIVRPIKAMSDRLHSMDPTTGERLPVPRWHANTEIGQLVLDINQLAERLVSTLAEERKLLGQREIDEKKYHAIFNNAESGIFIVNSSGSVSSWNPAFARLFEISASEGEDEYAWLHLGLLPWENPGQTMELIQAALRENTSLEKDVLIRLADDKPRWLNVALSPIGDDLLQGVVHDVTQLKEAEVSAKRMIVTDRLTGLANRAGLEERLHAHVLEYTYTQTGGFALLLVNLDEFKRVNEGMGLPAGDEILKATTTRLSSCVKSGDTVARLSADSFGIILKGITQGEVADKIAGRVLEAIRQTYFVDGSPVNLHASIGITLFPHDGMDVPTLLRQAELAMDNAKSSGGDGCVFFDPVLADAAEQRRHLETDIRNAIRNKEFVLFYQPVVDLRRNRLVGAEALIRWRHPTRGLVSPDSFIPLAEKTGLIFEIGLFVFDAACRQLLAWEQAGLDYTLSLNVSGRQIPDGLSPAKLLEVITHYGIAPGKIALEITEGVMLRDVEKSLVWLKAVHDLGFRVYLDDFGTGYSSLSYLKLFPVDTLKVDKSFVHDMRDDGNEHTLVGAIVAMGKSLGLDIVAEGVESPTHVRALRAMGCQFAQGFLFSRPVSAEDFNDAVTRIEALLADEINA